VSIIAYQFLPAVRSVGLRGFDKEDELWRRKV
jgi:hypothetical protein